MFEDSDAASFRSIESALNSPTSTIRSTSTIRTVDSGYSPSIISTRASRVSSNASLSSPQRSPIALFPDITLRGSLRSPRDESKRARAVSSASSTHSTHHRHVGIASVKPCLRRSVDPFTASSYRDRLLDLLKRPSAYMTMRCRKR